MTEAELWNMQRLAAADTSEALVEFRRAAMFMEQLTSQFGVESISPNAVVIPLYAVLMALLIPASVFFMYQIRGNPQLGAGGGERPWRADAGAGGAVDWTALVSE